MKRLLILLACALFASTATATPQNVDVRDFAPSPADWGPALNAAYRAAQAANLPLWLPPGEHNIITPLTWISTQPIIVYGDGAVLNWKGTGPCLTLGAPSGQRVMGVLVRGLTIWGQGCNTATTGLVLQNVTYSQLYGLSLSSLGTNLSLIADGEMCGYLSFYDLNCRDANTLICGTQATNGNACLNQVLFSRAILAGTAASQRFVVFGPTVQWHPDLWTFRDCDVEGPGGTLVLALLGTACGVEFNNTYFEATPQLTLAAPAGNVSLVDCKGHGVVLPATTGEKNQ